MDDSAFLTGEDLDTFWDFFDEDILDEDAGLMEQIADVETEVTNNL